MKKTEFHIAHYQAFADEARELMIREKKSQRAIGKEMLNGKGNEYGENNFSNKLHEKTAITPHFLKIWDDYKQHLKAKKATENREAGISNEIVEDPYDSLPILTEPQTKTEEPRIPVIDAVNLQFAIFKKEQQVELQAIRQEIESSRLELRQVKEELLGLKTLFQKALDLLERKS